MIIYDKKGELASWMHKYEQPEKVALFGGFRDTLLNLYVEHMALVKQATGTEDASALQATSFTLWKSAWDQVQLVPSASFLDMDDPESALRNFGILRHLNEGGVKRIFVDLVVAYAEEETFDSDVAKEILADRITFGPGSFSGTRDFLALAEAVILIHGMNKKKKVPAKDTKQLELLTEQAIGLTPPPGF